VTVGMVEINMAIIKQCRHLTNTNKYKASNETFQSNVH